MTMPYPSSHGANAESSLGLHAGDRVDRFTLLERLGGGGQGEVWKAQDALSPTPLVALKLVSMRVGASADLERARREARRLAQLRHPGLGRCTGLFEDLERGLVVLVLALVEGGPVSRALGDRRFDRTHREAVLVQVAHALAYLHSQGVVHRDLKPDNVLLSSRFWEAPFAPGAVTVVDLGIAVDVGNAAPLTQPMHVIGTPAFMAPEVIDPGTWGRGSGTTPTVDLFAFGVLGWCLITGTHPSGLPSNATVVDYAMAYRAAGQGQTSWPVTSLEHPWANALRACLTLSPATRHLPVDAFVAMSPPVHGAGESRLITRPAIPLSLPTSPRPERTSVADSSLPEKSWRGEAVPLAGSPPPQFSARGERRGRGGWLGGTLVVLGLGLVALAWSLHAADDSATPRQAPPRSTRPTPAAPTVTATDTPPPTAEVCRCDAARASLPCGSGHETLPFACRASLPSSSSWQLRLSHVTISVAGKHTNLVKVSPRATVTLCLAGTTSCATTHVDDVQAPSCARGSRLPVTIADLTGAGLDITVTEPSGRVLVDARGVRYTSIGTMAACDGLLFGKKELGPGDVDLVGVFLDDP